MGSLITKPTDEFIRLNRERIKYETKPNPTVEDLSYLNKINCELKQYNTQLDSGLSNFDKLTARWLELSLPHEPRNSL